MSVRPAPVIARLAAAVAAPVTALMSLAMLVGCAATETATRIDGADDHIVMLAPAGLAGNRLPHPAIIEAATLAEDLSSLYFEEQGRLLRASRQPVFDREEADELATMLARGLSQASGEQRIDFVSHGRSGATLGNARKTEGTVFIDGNGELNIAFAGVRHMLTVDDDFTRFRDFSLGDPLATDRSLVRVGSDRPGISPRKRADGSVYPMWVTVSQVATEPETEARTATEAAPLPGRTVEASQEATHREAEGEAPVAADTTTAIRQRLEFLKRLYEDGLITETEYRNERERALRRLP
ncbi:MAG: hypothetical protein JJU31_16525 [Wenzhouxiangella sp.]|nr:hypothetical protein [Wenzhouxiangella sp.]MCH8477976.1 hypothetical protein [Wenzhouxiangella sp.]